MQRSIDSIGERDTLDQELEQIAAGRLFADRYLIQHLIGQGGMGKVYLACDQMLDNELVALKLLHLDLSADERHTKRFLREVQLTRRVTSAQVVRTFDVGMHADHLFFTMEFVEGVSLKDRLTTHGKFSPDDAAQILVQICRGLAAIHAAGIIHRDLKPANVILCQDGSIKIADFGVARPGRSDLTRHDEVVGSAAYMAPEVWHGSEVGPCADIYALGVLAYELVTGEIPYEAESPAQMMRLHLEGTVPHASRTVPGIPLWFDSLIIRMMARDPLKRQQSTAEIADLLEEKLKRRSETNVSVRSSQVVSASVVASAGHAAPQSQVISRHAATSVQTRPASEKRLSNGQRLVHGAGTAILTLAMLLLVAGPVNGWSNSLTDSARLTQSWGTLLLAHGVSVAIHLLLFSLPLVMWGVSRTTIQKNIERGVIYLSTLGVLWMMLFVSQCIRLGGVSSGRNSSGGSQGLKSVVESSLLNLTEVFLFIQSGTVFSARALRSGDVTATGAAGFALLRDPHASFWAALPYYLLLGAVLLLIASTLRREFTGRRGFRPQRFDFLILGALGVVCLVFSALLPPLLSLFGLSPEQIVVFHISTYTYGIPLEILVCASLAWVLITALANVLGMPEGQRPSSKSPSRR